LIDRQATALHRGNRIFDVPQVGIVLLIAAYMLIHRVLQAHPLRAKYESVQILAMPRLNLDARADVGCNERIVENGHRGGRSGPGAI